MKKFPPFASCIVLALAISDASAWIPLTLQSGSKQVPLLELYTSEGCSSCPPAEEWLSHLKNDPDLWRKFIPIAFHVDYWNYLGWADSYSSDSFTARQRAYSAAWGSPTIYTPEFVLNGREWRPFDLSIPPSQRQIGTLKASITTKGNLAVVFEPTAPIVEPLAVEASLLGMGISTSVRRGENAGRTLKHDFLSLGVMSAPLQSINGGRYEATLTLPDHPSVPAAALVLWVHSQKNPTPLQSVGGWLSEIH